MHTFGARNVTTAITWLKIGKLSKKCSRSGSCWWCNASWRNPAGLHMSDESAIPFPACHTNRRCDRQAGRQTARQLRTDRPTKDTHPLWKNTAPSILSRSTFTGPPSAFRGESPAHLSFHLRFTFYLILPIYIWINSAANLSATICIHDSQFLCLVSIFFSFFLHHTNCPVTLSSP